VEIGFVMYTGNPISFALTRNGVAITAFEFWTIGFIAVSLRPGVNAALRARDVGVEASDKSARLAGRNGRASSGRTILLFEVVR
jgi:hypothetical protein